jgi:hypothetical protein
MSYEVALPDGRVVEFPDSVPHNEAERIIREQLLAPKPKEGLIAGLQKGAESTFSQLRSGIGSLIGSPEEAARAGLERGEDINKRYAQQVSLDKVKQAYEDKGLLSAAGEALGQIPYALAEQIPNLVTNIGGARLGALAGSPFGPVGSIIGGGAGFFAPSVLQQLGGNVERQAAEGQPVSVGQALPTAVLQGGLDVAGSFIPLGGRLVSKLTGLPVEALLGRTSAQAAKLAEERLLATLAKGTATGAFVEIPTEVTQQMLQRAQAGLPLTSPDALKEYGETAYQAGLLGPLGAVGRMSEVGGARQQVEQEQMLDMRQKRIAGLEQEEKDRAAQEAEKAQAEQARQEQLKDPEFAMQAEARYNDLQQQFASLREQANSKVDPTDLAGIEARNAARQQLKAFKKTDEYKSVMDDYQQTASIRDNLKKQREEQTRIQTEAARQKTIQDELAAMQPKWALGQPDAQTTIPGLAPMETENVPPPPQEDLTARRSEFMQKQQELAQLMESHQRKEADAAAKGDIDALDKLRPQRQMLLNEQEYLNKQLGEMGAEPADDSLDAIRAKIEKQKAQLQSLGGEGYDPVKADKIINTIRALEEKAKTAKPGQAGLDFGKATKEQVSESTTDFGNRVIGPEIAAGREAAKQAREKTEGEIEGIRRVAATDKTQTPAKEALQDKRTGLEIAAMEKNRLPQDVTEQLDMFGYPLAGGVVTGEKTAAPKSRAELVSELRIARITGNRTAAAELVEKIRDLDAQAVGYKGETKTMDTKGLTQPTVPFAKPAMPGQQPLRSRQQQAYADARAKAYADMVAIVSKYNQGKAKLSELETARGTLVENLIGDIEATRGSFVEKEEADQIRRDANAMLYDLVTRFGDTRNLTQKGTAKRPLFIPTQDTQGKFTSEAQYPTVESRAPGRQTFANPHAAALAIKEGLDDIRNKSVSQGSTTIERTLTPKETTKKSLEKSLELAKTKKLSADQENILDQIEDNFAVINADAKKRDTASEYIYRASNELPIDDALIKDVRALFSKSVDTERQLELNNKWGMELRGRIFDTPEEFTDYLSGDALQRMRSNLGFVTPTLARLTESVEPFVARAQEYAKQIDELDKQYQQMRTERANQLKALKEMSAEDQEREYVERADAETALREAEGKLKALVDKLDKELHGLQAAYIEAEQALVFSVKTSEDITKAIEKNRIKFQTESETDTLNKLSDAKTKLSKLLTDKLKLKNATVGPNMDWSTALGSFKQRPDVAETQKAIGDLTRKLRNQLARDPAHDRVVAFLDKDLDLQSQFEDELDMMDAAAQQFDKSRTKLHEAKQKQDNNTKNKKALKEATAELEAAEKAKTETESQIATRKETVRKLEEELGVERVTGTKLEKGTLASETFEQIILKSTDAEKELSEQLANLRSKLTTAQQAGTGALEAFINRREKSRAVREETQAQREERDKVQKRLENEQTARLKAIPGEQVSFEGRRKLIETLDATPERLSELDSIINDEKAPAKDVAEAASAKKRLENKVEDIGKLLSNDGEVAKKVTEFLDTRISKVEENIKKVTQRLQSPDKYDPILAKKRLSKADREAALVGKKKLKAGRVKEINNYKRELAELNAKRDAKRGIERKEVGTQRYVEDVAPKGAARTLVPIDRKEGAAPEIGATKKLREAYEAAVKDDATDVEYKGRTYALEDVRSYLAARKIGPVVVKTVTAGNIRTGEASTLGERMLSTKNKPTQAGQARPITSLQAQRGAAKDVAKQQAEKRMDEIDAMRPKIAVAIEKAEAENDAERLKNLNALEAKLDKQYDELEKTMSYVPKPTKSMTAAQIAEQQERVRNRAGEEEDLEGAPVKYRTVEKTGPGLKIDNIQELSDRITKDWTIKPNIKIVATEKDLPGRIQEQAAKDEKTGRIPGLYDPSTRTVYLVAENLKDGDDVAFTLAHEIAGHFGLQQLLGRNYAETMDNLYNGNETVRKQADAKLRTEKNLDRNTAVEEVLAEMAEQGVSPDPDTRSALRKIIDAIKNWFAGNGFKVSDNEVKELVANARKYVMEGKRPNVESVSLGSGKILYRTNATYANADFAAAGRTTDKFVAKQKTFAEKVRAEGSGLTFETMLVDRFAGFERLKKLMEPLVGTQMMYYLRMYDQRMNFVSQAVGNGALKIIEKERADGRIERVIEAGGGASIKNVVNILKQATPIVGNGEAVNRLFTMYMSAIRAQDKGFAALHFGTDLTEADLKAAKATVDSYPEVKKTFEAARAEYNQYNKDMLNFLAQTGAISKQVATDLTKNNDYIPWYRERNGFAELVIGAESPIRIGNITEQPYLHELVGGERPILDFMTSSVQNTNMLTDMGLRNLSTKNAVIELANLNLAKITPKPIQGTDVVRFKIDGEDRYAIINTDDAGVPADILVKGMEGIPTQMPVAMRLMGMPATFLRKAVTASPLYAARQLFRDSLAAPILAGADFMPVIGAVRQIGKGSTKETLERRGITGGQIFTGSSEDISKILRDIANDNSSWVQAFGKLEAINMAADASTRRAQYNSYINQGLSEMEATLMSLESMNFNKRGASPSVHWANSLIPFFNAQIQGLNVLYKAIGGKLPFNEKLKIQRKILLRGGMIAAGTLAYTAAMQDDEAYKNARPEEKYGNWFIRIPGVDEPLRLPIPFEIGYIFKALPEALYNSMVNDHGSEEAVKAFSSILKQTIPGGSSYGIPQAMRPAIEAGLGKSFYTGRDILSASEKDLLPEYQFRDKTSEVAKTIGSVAGVSPIILDSLVQGYTGAMGLAFVQAVGVGLTKQEGPQTAVKRLSDLPVVGSAFQPNDAGAISNRVYERMNEFKKVKSSVDNLLNRGYKAEALELLNKRGTEYAMAEVADYYTSTMRELTQYEKAIKASSATPEEKRRQLEELRKLKTRFSATVEQATDKTIPQ